MYPGPSLTRWYALASSYPLRWTLLPQAYLRSFRLARSLVSERVNYHGRKRDYYQDNRKINCKMLRFTACCYGNFNNIFIAPRLTTPVCTKTTRTSASESDNVTRFSSLYCIPPVNYATVENPLLSLAALACLAAMATKSTTVLFVVSHVTLPIA